MITYPFKMVVVDMDGTLLRPDHTVSDITVEVTQKLRKKGVHLVIATGRPYADIRHIINAIRFETEGDHKKTYGFCYIITSNGARVFDAQGNLVLKKNIPEEMCRLLYALGKEDAEVNVNVFRNLKQKEGSISVIVPDNNPASTEANTDGNLDRTDNDEEWVCRRPAEEEAKLYEKSKFHYRIEEDLDSTYPTDNVSEIFFLCYNPEKALDLEAKILKLNSDYIERVTRTGEESDVSSLGIEVSPSAAHCLDIVPKSTSKGAALTDVANRLGCTMEDIIAFGDGMNDVSMLSIVRKGCIMSNANKRLKEALPNLEVIGSNADDGVARKLIELFQL